jgi:hypothetical protein
LSKRVPHPFCTEGGYHKIPQYAATFERSPRVKQVATVRGKNLFTMMGFAGEAQRTLAAHALAFV